MQFLHRVYICYFQRLQEIFKRTAEALLGEGFSCRAIVAYQSFDMGQFFTNISILRNYYCLSMMYPVQDFNVYSKRLKCIFQWWPHKIKQMVNHQQKVLKKIVLLKSSPGLIYDRVILSICQWKCKCFALNVISNTAIENISCLANTNYSYYSLTFCYSFTNSSHFANYGIRKHIHTQTHTRTMQFKSESNLFFLWILLLLLSVLY